MNKWLTAIAALLCSITVNAATEFTVDGIEYTVASTDGTCSVSDYDESFGTEVVIPSSVDYRNRTFSVTSIGNSAFKDCSSLTSITIPENVTSIGDYAFNKCISLKEVIFEDGNEILSLGYASYGYKDVHIGKGLFYDCPLEKVYLGRNLNYKSDYANGYSPFNEKTSLTSVTIGDSVTWIGSSAFRGCTSLTSINIPVGVTSIGGNAFTGCGGEVTVNCNIPTPSSGESGVFYKSKLTKVTIGESVTSIGNYAFNGCTSLEEVVFEDGSETLNLGYNEYNDSYGGEGLFYDCPLENVYLGRNLSYSSSYSCGNSPFYESGRYPTISLGDCITSISACLFYGNSSLTSVTIPESVTSIGGSAFCGCSSLTSITIPERVTSIGDSAFSYCYKLTAINIPESVRSIGDRAFYDCSSLTSISCLATTPPTIYMDTFDSDAYNFADLFVPQGTKDAYQAATGWKNFYFINDTLPSGIDNITVGQSPKIYDLNGRELQAPQQGINIVGGRKVLVK